MPRPARPSALSRPPGEHIRIHMLLLSLLLTMTLGDACSPALQCDEATGISKLTLDPSRSPCTRDCECNNQHYTGICQPALKICFAYKREPCATEGLQRPCIIPEDLRKDGCKDGTQICKAPGLTDLYWGDCKPIAPKSTETGLCQDNIDNDCDGKTDQADPDCKAACNPGKIEPCYSGSQETLNKGECRAGQRQCQDNGTWAECKGEVTPTKETCNGKDDDCDGEVDEDLSSKSCDTGKSGDCKEGKEQCQSGKIVCVPTAATAETCNQKDDDCDGEIDEGVPNCGSNTSCKAGETQPCYGGGAECTEKEGKITCTGACKPGTRSCFNGSWGDCTGDVKPVTEVCNDKDDDCDGQIDEDNPDGGKDCKTGKPGVCEEGQEQCQSGKLVCVSKQTASAETCDDLDNDCDGQIDEGIAGCVSLAAGTPPVPPANIPQIGYQDGPARQAKFTNTTRMTLDAKGDLYVAASSYLRKLDTAGLVSTFIGKNDKTSNDGPASQSTLPGARGLAVDQAGAVYFSQANKIRKVAMVQSDTCGTQSGYTGLCVTTIAGTATAEHRDGSASTARFDNPSALALDSKGNLYIAERHCIRKLDTAGQVTTVAGQVITDAQGKTSCQSGYQDGPATSAKFALLGGIVLDAQDQLYAADKNNRRIRKVAMVQNATCGSQSGYTGLCVTTIAGTGTKGRLDGPALQATFEEPSELALSPQGELYISDKHQIRKLDNNDNISTFAGDGKCSGSIINPGNCYKNGPALQAQFFTIQGLVTDKQGNLYVTDRNHVVRRINP